MNGDTKRLAIPPPGAFCTHEEIDECCHGEAGRPGCGHWSCPCGVSWDDWGEGGPLRIGPVREVGERRPRRVGPRPRRRGRKKQGRTSA